LGDWADRVRRRPGTPLPRPQRDFFERGFGCSLEPIRIHVDRGAAEALGAAAFAVGRHIVLREPPRDWDAPVTRYLLGHEIAHCLQQRTVGDAAPAAAVGAADDPLEREAHRAAADILAGRRAGPLSREARAVVRRAVTVAPKSANITPNKQPPAGTKPEWLVNTETGEEIMAFQSDGFIATGTAKLRGDSVGEVAGYTLGWIQCQLMETNWAIYRGNKDDDGSTLLDFGWKPPMAVCRDTHEEKAVLYDEAYDSGGANRFVAPKGLKEVNMTCEFRDFPRDDFQLQVTNSLTNKPNFLDEAMIEIYFCTVLTLQSPGGEFQHLKHIFWNVRWHYRFTPKDAKGVPGVLPVKGEDPGKYCLVQDGAPTDARILDKLTDGKTTNCTVRMRGRDPIVTPRKGKSETFDTKRLTRSADGTADTIGCFKKK
jgi:hypothetical protein